MTDETLADAPAAAETVDVSPALDPEDFDFEAFLSGVRPTRRAVRVYARADLVAQMEEVAAGYRDDAPAAEKRRIRDEVLALRAQFEASGAWFVAEARSAERVGKVRDESARRHGIDLEANEGQVRYDEYAKIERDLLADCIVTPAVTPEQLARFADTAPTEYAKLVTAMKAANSILAQNATVVTRDFSPAPSAKSGTAGSKRR